MVFAGLVQIALCRVYVIYCNIGQCFASDLQHAQMPYLQDDEISKIRGNRTYTFHSLLIAT
jgi:hypothetical protein